MEKAFTLVEILIVIALIALLLIGLLIFMNPTTQIEKSWDGKRKKELDTLRKTFEEYYNDKNCYPKPTEVCQDDPQLLSSSYVCSICGGELKGYLSTLPCDPQHPNRKYLYEVDNTTCPSYYKVYTKLSNTNDPIIAEVGCSAGCAPEGYTLNSPEDAFNYGITSPNTSLSLSDSFVQWACKVIDPNTGNFVCDPCCYSQDICPPGVTLECNTAVNQEGYFRIYDTKTNCINACLSDYQK